MSSVNEEYVVGWKDHGNNFSLSFNDLLQGNKLVDVQLVAEGHLIGAHRLVLSALSPYFSNMFTQMPANQQAFVFLKDISKQTMDDLITYVYLGEVNVKRECLDEFMNAAQALNINGLADGSFSHSLYSRPTNHPTPAKPTFDGSSYQSFPMFNHPFGSADVQYQSVQRSTTSNNQYQQPMNGYQPKQDGFDFKHQNQMCSDYGYDSNYDPNLHSGKRSDNCSMNEYEDEPNDEGANDNELKTMATVPKRFKTNKDFTEYDVEADIRVINNRENLFHNNHIFGKHLKPNANGSQRWRCTKAHSRKCRAAINTMIKDGVTMMKTLITEHTHEPTD